MNNDKEVYQDRTQSIDIAIKHCRDMIIRGEKKHRIRLIGGDGWTFEVEMTEVGEFGSEGVLMEESDVYCVEPYPIKQIQFDVTVSESGEAKIEENRDNFKFEINSKGDCFLTDVMTDLCSFEQISDKSPEGLEVLKGIMEKQKSREALKDFKFNEVSGYWPNSGGKTDFYFQEQKNKLCVDTESIGGWQFFAKKLSGESSDSEKDELKE
jgi:hypothetical protein